MTKTARSVLGDQLRQFREHLSLERRLSDLTVSAYVRDLEQYDAFLVSRGKRSAAAVRVEDVEAYVGERAWAASTVARKIASLRAFHEFLRRRGHAEENPALQIRPPRQGRPLPDVLTVPEVESLLGATRGEKPAEVRDRAMLELAYATGLRATELVRLTLEEVDLEEDLVRCFGKRSRERIAPFGVNAKRALVRYLEAARATFLRERGERTVFLTRLGRGFTRMGYWKLLEGYRKAAVSSAPSRRIRCAIRARRTSWKGDATCAWCRSSWDIARSRRRGSTPIWTVTICARSTPAFIHAPEALPAPGRIDERTCGGYRDGLCRRGAGSAVAHEGGVPGDFRSEGAARSFSSTLMRRQPAPVSPRTTPTSRRQRKGTLSLGAQIGYGFVRGSSELNDHFDSGLGYGVRFRYMMSARSALAFSFEHQKYGTRAGLPVDTGPFAAKDSELIVTTVATEVHVFFHRDRDLTPYVLGGFGFASPNVIYETKESRRVDEGPFGVVGLGFERFIRPRVSLDFTLRGFAEVGNSELSLMSQLTAGIHVYPGD